MFNDILPQMKILKNTVIPVLKRQLKWFLTHVFRDNFSKASFFENLKPEKNIQEYLRYFLQTVPTSKMLQLHLCIDAPFEYFKQGANNPSQRCLSNSYVAPPLFTY